MWDTQRSAEVDYCPRCLRPSFGEESKELRAEVERLTKELRIVRLQCSNPDAAIEFFNLASRAEEREQTLRLALEKIANDPRINDEPGDKHDSRPAWEAKQIAVKALALARRNPNE